MDINQGDIYWAALDKSSGFPHPQVVIQEDAINHSRISSVVVCALSTNLKRAKAPGNVFLNEGEANLPKRSVVLVAQVSAIDKSELSAYIGTLDAQRVSEILAGMRFQQRIGRQTRELCPAKDS
jgi:mRNA interferase MazF